MDEETKRCICIKLFGTSDKAVASERAYALFADAMLGYVWIRFAASSDHYVVADALLSSKRKATVKGIAALSNGRLKGKDVKPVLDDFLEARLVEKCVEKRCRIEADGSVIDAKSGSVRRPRCTGVTLWYVNCKEALDAMLYCLSATMYPACAAAADQRKMSASSNPSSSSRSKEDEDEMIVYLGDSKEALVFRDECDAIREDRASSAAAKTVPQIVDRVLAMLSHVKRNGAAEILPSFV